MVKRVPVVMENLEHTLELFLANIRLGNGGQVLKWSKNTSLQLLKIHIGFTFNNTLSFYKPKKVGYSEQIV